jgi:hypothetical protein
MKSTTAVFSSLVLAFGIAAAGWFVGNGFFQGRASERFVTVKGVAERDVKADIALWPLQFVATHDDLGVARAKIKDSYDSIMVFLKRQGIDPLKAELQHLEVTDRLADPYRSGSMQSRYIITQSLMVRSLHPEQIFNATQAVGQLVDAGVILSNTGAGGGGTYLFTRLSDIKPEMIAEATAKARRAAEQFASDSGSQLGAIRRARQGLFVIQPRDRAPGIMESNQIDKTVRVVSTIEYYLTD